MVSDWHYLKKSKNANFQLSLSDHIQKRFNLSNYPQKKYDFFFQKIITSASFWLKKCAFFP